MYISQNNHLFDFKVISLMLSVATEQALIHFRGVFHYLQILSVAAESQQYLPRSKGGCAS